MECDYKIILKMQRFKSFQKNGNKITKHINAKEQKERIKEKSDEVEQRNLPSINQSLSFL